MRRISYFRQRITNFLYKYYELNYTSGNDIRKIGYVGFDNDIQKLPLITKKDFILNKNSQFAINSYFLDEKAFKPHLTENEFIEIMANWEAAKLKIWDDPIYTIYNINESKRIELEYTLTRFLTYRASIGSILDEFAEVVSFVSPEDIFKNRDKFLPKRKKYLSSIDSIFNFKNRLCVGGPLVLFAAETEDDLAIILQRRSFNVSDEPGTITVIPKAFHQPTINPLEEVDIQVTIFRECYEELLGGEELYRGRRYISHLYFKKNEAIKELYNNQICKLQPLGLIFDLLRGNYYIAYCMYVYDFNWWEKYNHDIRVNWEVDESIQPAIMVKKQSDLINEYIHRKEWAPESYFTFIEGLRWLNKESKKMEKITTFIPELKLEKI